MPRRNQPQMHAIPSATTTRSCAASSSGSGIDVLWPQTLTLLGFGIGILTSPRGASFRKNLD
ncbi:MAG: hypothetical protein IPK72_21405 [Candidatus Eisenbacteria bacterium]|nr:hypothetical protein [Candidatus Eisenbacteria bacterium]